MLNVTDLMQKLRDQRQPSQRERAKMMCFGDP